MVKNHVVDVLVLECKHVLRIQRHFKRLFSRRYILWGYLGIDPSLTKTTKCSTRGNPEYMPYKMHPSPLNISLRQMQRWLASEFRVSGTFGLPSGNAYSRTVQMFACHNNVRQNVRNLNQLHRA